MTTDIHSCSYYCQRPECVARRVPLFEALYALETMCRDGRGPFGNQSHVATSHGFHSIGTTTEDFAAAVIALEKTTRLPSVAS